MHFKVSSYTPSVTLSQHKGAEWVQASMEQKIKFVLTTVLFLSRVCSESTHVSVSTTLQLSHGRFKRTYFIWSSGYI